MSYGGIGFGEMFYIITLTYLIYLYQDANLFINIINLYLIRLIYIEITYTLIYINKLYVY